MRRWLVVLIAFCLPACAGKHSFFAKATAPGSITIDGEKEPAWLIADSIISFTNPWNKEVAPKTSLAVLKDDQNLYFYFTVADEDVVLVDDWTGERDVEKEDRVELFFSKDKEMKEYYCFEIDPKGRTLSYKASHYRQFDFLWEVPDGYRTAARMHTGGYTVEGAIPLSFLSEIAIDNTLYFGAYRAAFSIHNDSLIENWLTWVDPGVPAPDFHVPASLGKLSFAE